MKRILVVCGMGVATSTVANKTITDYLKDNGVQATITQAKVTEMAGYKGSVDLVVLMATGAQVPEGFDVPVIKGLPFLTGVGKQEALEEIIRVLQ
ncbi:MAG: PTS sugar transporter subunit IIB [Coprobacillus sp.]